MTLLLEVKGLSGNVTSVELTPNEYQNAKQMGHQYKICIVTTALHNPHLEIYSYDVDHFLTKPVSVETILSKIEYFLKRVRDIYAFTDKLNYLIVMQPIVFELRTD